MNSALQRTNNQRKRRRGIQRSMGIKAYAAGATKTELGADCISVLNVETGQIEKYPRISKARGYYEINRKA